MVEVKVGFEEVEVDQAFAVPGAELVAGAEDATGATDGDVETVAALGVVDGLTAKGLVVGAAFEGVAD